MKSTLNIAFLHLSIKHKQQELNRQLILDKIAETSVSGADIILAPEMATSGYAFTAPSDAAAFSESLDGEFVEELKLRCVKTGCWVCIGMPILGTDKKSVYNGAIVIDGHGSVQIVYRKVMAEYQWATQGSCDISGVVDSPWGRIGVLICSDTYYGLLPRLRKLQNTDLLLVPANWPTSSFAPERIWAVCARLNGMYVAVCNRTGIDKTLDCTNAVSCCFSPQGDTLLSGRSHESTVFTVSVPLYNGKLKTPPCIPSCKDLYKIKSDIDNEDKISEDNLVVGVCNGYCKHSGNRQVCIDLSNENKKSVFVCMGCHDEKEIPLSCVETLKNSSVIQVRQLSDTTCSIDYLQNNAVYTLPVVQQVNGINIGVVPYETAMCAEYMFRLAQSGCNVCVVLGDVSGHLDDILYNCVHRMAIISIKDKKPCISVPPGGHETWDEYIADKDGFISAAVPFSAVCSKKWLRKLDKCMNEYLELTKKYE